MTISEILSDFKIDIQKIKVYEHFKKTFREKTCLKLVDLMLSDKFRNTFKSNHIELLERYKTFIQNDEIFIKYNQRFELGRHYPDDNKSIISLPRVMKHTIMKMLGWIDADMVSAHPTFACQVGKLANQPFHYIQQYIDDRDTILQNVIDTFSIPENPITRDEAKSLFNIMAYGGGFSTWKTGENSLNNKPILDIKTGNTLKFIKSFKRDCKTAKELIYQNNPEIIQKVKGKLILGSDELKRRVCSYFYGVIENDALYDLYQFLLNKHSIVDCEVSPEYDGMCFKPMENIDYQSLFDEFSDIYFNENNFRVNFKVKSYDRVRQDILDEMKILSETNVDVESVESVAICETAICETETPSPITITQSFSPIIITNENNFMIPVEILYLGSNDVSRFIAPKLSEIMKYSRILEIWIAYNERTHFWEKIKKPEATLATFLQKALNNTRQWLINQQTKNLSSGKQSDPQIEKELQQTCNWYAKASHKSDLSEMKDFLTTYICDDNFINTLDNNTYQLTFQNGILDLKTMKFRNGLVKEDYLTKCIPCNYVKPSLEQVSDVRKELLKICNNYESYLEYYLSLIGYCLTGDAEREQIFGYFRGQSASNGKSVIFEVLEDVMPNYVKKAENKLFDATFDMKKELPSFYGKRLIWVNELSEQKKDADRLKAFADGTTYSFGRNYATESEILNVIFKIIIVSNYSLNIKADNGVVRRFKLCQFNSKFDENYTEDNYEKLEFKKDKNFGTKLRNEFKMALIELLAQYGNHYWNEKNLKEYPIEWSEEASENMNDNNKFDVWFNENFTFDKNELKEEEKGLFVGKQFMTDMLPTDLRNVKINDELKRMRLNFTYDKGKRYKTAKGIYIGFGLKKQLVEEDTNRT